jgi:hypothetical protein
MIKPTFLYCGTAKAGSSWIFEICREHPEIYIPLAKDIMFFSKSYDKGTTWYFNHFKKASSDQAIGEICHDYFLKEEFAERIKTDLPDVKIIFCLRNPLSWVLSAHSFTALMTKVPKDYLTFLDSETYINGITFADYLCYSKNLKYFYERFTRKNIKVMFFEEIKKSPEAFAYELYAFIGVEPNFQPLSLLKKVNISQGVRNENAAHLIYKTAYLVRRLGFPNMVGRIKRSFFNNQSFANKLLYTPVKKPQMDKQTMQTIYDRFSTQYPELEELTGRKLPHEWNPDHYNFQ